MLKRYTIFEQSSEYYDNEMLSPKVFDFELQSRISTYTNELREQNCYNFFKISNSMKLTKIRCKQKAEQVTKNFYLRVQEDKLFDVDSIFFKRFNKVFSSFLLNILRNNSK